MEVDEYIKWFKLCADYYVKNDPTTDNIIYQDDKFGTVNKILRKQYNPNYNKFLVLSGSFGTGKSTLMKIISKMNERSNIRMKHIEAKALIKGVQNHGTKFLSQFEKCRLCINDYGFSEDKANYFGNKIYVIDDLVYHRWERFGLSTFFTTNYVESDDFVNSLLDIRLVERIENNLEWIYFTGKNYRKQN